MTTAAVVPAAETAVASADDFDKAFSEAITALDKPAAVETKPAVVETKPAAAAVEVKPAAATEVVPVAEVKPAAETVVAEEGVTETTPAAEVKPAAETATPRQLAEEAAKKLADEATARHAAEETARQAAEQREIKDPVLTTEDNAMFESFRKEWPDVAKSVEKMVAHNAALLEAKYARALIGVVGKIYDDMGPLAQSVGNVEAGSFRSSVLEAHPDYDAVYPKLEGWITGQPPYLAAAYKRVYDEGNVQEVSDLVGRYKAANGIQPQTQTTTAAPAPTTPAAVPTKPAASPATLAAAAALAPVQSKRTTPTKQGEDPMDFDGAFAAAVAEQN